MKTTDSRDPLDRKIDELLSKQPLKASDDFLARTLAEIDEPQSAPKSSKRPSIIRFALPAAAAIAVALLLATQLQQSQPDTPTQITGASSTQPETQGEPLNEAPGASQSPALELTRTEIEELFLLQEGLSGFAGLETEAPNPGDLLNTLDALYSI
jgi:hypothetical protein